ncbi:hypothetical protein NDU88_000212 [Pleurodeles waltl]|uniref:Uncharacterized protein n=1 Tax=Pleurodeles waltl TaxID=8319 RepID=A0AAV7TF33_PLEWA|nr:hypothetical protein NDU88_000212 [Pleurodeles waltl]
MLRRGAEEGRRQLRGPLDRGRGRIAPSGGAAGSVGTCRPGERRAALRPSGGGGVLPGWTARSALGLQDQDFSPVKKSGGSQTSRALPDPSSTGVRGAGHPGRALYEFDFTARPRLSYKLRTAGGAHRQDIGEDIRLSAKLKGPRRRRVHRGRSRVGPKATSGANSWKGACPGPGVLHVGTVQTREHVLHEQPG